MMRRLLSQHGMAECPKRTQPCKYCGKEFVFDTIQVGFTHSLLSDIHVTNWLIFGVMEPVSGHIFSQIVTPVSVVAPVICPACGSLEVSMLSSMVSLSCGSWMVVRAAVWAFMWKHLLLNTSGQRLKSHAPLPHVLGQRWNNPSLLFFPIHHFIFAQFDGDDMILRDSL